METTKQLTYLFIADVCCLCAVAECDTETERIPNTARKCGEGKPMYINFNPNWEALCIVAYLHFDEMFSTLNETAAF